MYKDVCGGVGGLRFADFISFFLNIPLNLKKFGLTETKLFHFHRILKTEGREGEFDRAS